jgi:hydroxymethylpyrimidine/phosphomethylpyrimidine kinase
MSPSKVPPPVLSIAGSDPSGGAGIQSDLATFAAYHVHGFSVLTAVIAQNSAAVERTEPVAPAMVRAQIESVVAEAMPRAVKTGVLGSAAIVRAVARAIADLRMPPPVVDPVMVSSAGVPLLDLGGTRALRRFLIPLAIVVTPNLAEAEALTGIRCGSDDAIRAAAREIVAMGARAVVIKGGHRRGAPADLFHDGRRFVELRAARIAGGGVHGSGCVFSAAIAASLARGMDLLDAVRAAKRYVTAAIRQSYRYSGRPLPNHFPR